jgi:hypothetical protein
MNTTIIRSTHGNVPQREYTRDVPKHFDSGDIDNNGRWYGSTMCCLECRDTDTMRMGIGGLYLLATLECDNCSAVFAETWNLRGVNR